jgi:hypothetical protein
MAVARRAFSFKHFEPNEVLPIFLFVAGRSGSAQRQTQ